MSCLEDYDVSKYLALRSKATEYAKGQRYEKALGLYQQMYEIRPSAKLQSKISKIQNYLLVERESSDEETSDMIILGNGYTMSRCLYDKLYPYQKEGINWLWQLFNKRKGGILADDMGMGKTVQMISFLSGLFDTRKIKTVLIVMPVSLIKNWEDEFDKWCPGMMVLSYHGSSVREKERSLLKIQKRGGVLLTSYGLLVTSHHQLSSRDGRSFKWDYIILDEGHKIKNPTKTTQAAHDIVATHRLVLTGTPVQNNLRELWALYDFCHQGSLLGTLATFKVQYENPIITGREKDATSGEKKYGGKIAENLRKLIEPYFLRRTKAEHFTCKENIDPSSKSVTLPQKNEFILWVYLSDKQIEIYSKFLKSDDVQRIMSSTKSPLVHLNVLKKICDHPRLFTRRACAELDMETSFNQSIDDPMADTVSINVDPNLLLRESGKMEALILLLENLKENGHRTLVFSMSRKILDIVEKILTFKKWRIVRLDGTITKMEERQARIAKFQENSKYPVMLLTTQVGGVGLTITAADRVVIYDPSWNPATDAQAVDRAYRIGQTKPVVVYRFITCGSIEEKIYRRQIFKDSITRQVSSRDKKDENPHRYFAKSELSELFILDDPTKSDTQRQVEKLHAHNRKTTTELDAHIAFLLSLEKHVYNISDHDLMFGGEVEDEPEKLMPASDNNEYLDDDYIQRRVQAAQEQLTKESKMVEESVKHAGTYKTSYFTEKKKFGQRTAPAATISKAPGSTLEDVSDDSGARASDPKPLMLPLIFTQPIIEDEDIVSQLDKNFKDFGFEKADSMAPKIVIETVDSHVKPFLQRIKERNYSKPEKSDTLLETKNSSPLNLTPITSDESFSKVLSSTPIMNPDDDIPNSFVEDECLGAENAQFQKSSRRKSTCAAPVKAEIESSDDERLYISSSD